MDRAIKDIEFCTGNRTGQMFIKLKDETDVLWTTFFYPSIPFDHIGICRIPPETGDEFIVKKSELFVLYRPS